VKPAMAFYEPRQPAARTTNRGGLHGILDTPCALTSLYSFTGGRTAISESRPGSGPDGGLCTTTEAAIRAHAGLGFRLCLDITTNGSLITRRVQRNNAFSTGHMALGSDDNFTDTSRRSDSHGLRTIFRVTMNGGWPVAFLDGAFNGAYPNAVSRRSIPLFYGRRAKGNQYLGNGGDGPFPVHQPGRSAGLANAGTRFCKWARNCHHQPVVWRNASITLSLPTVIRPRGC